MMQFTRLLGGLLLATLMAACGGGGGSPGATVGSSAPSTTPKTPTLKLAMQDASGTPTNSISASGVTLVTATAADPGGAPIPNQVVDVTGDGALVVFPEGNTALTNSKGVATIKVTRASLIATGAGTLTANYTIKAGTLTSYSDGSVPPTSDTLVTGSIGYQLATNNISLSNLDVGATTLAAYGTRQVSVQANLNGAAATATPVQVSFTASCGQILPATATTNSSGVAAVSYTATDVPGTSTVATLGCGGQNVVISASTFGSPVISKTLSVTAAPATNMSFVNVLPSTIFLANSGGATQAMASFKLVNSLGAALSGQSVVLSLKTLNGGIPKATIGSLGNTTPVTLITDSTGKVSVPVFSGSVPTNVIVNAALASNPLIQTDSSILTIASGRAAQARVSLAIEKWSIEGLNIDGTTTDITMSLADRQGNPVPDGTAVNFVTEGGVMIPPVCSTGGTKDPATGLFSQPGNSRCTVQIRSQNPRPANGRVSILAYAAGEEDFVDANFNNVYDCGEAFTDLGTATRDDNENGSYDVGEFSVPRVASDSLCGTGVAPSPQSGDGVWGAADVRKQAIVIFASSQAVIAGAFQPPVTVTVPAGTGTTSTTAILGLDVVVGDLLGNSMPTGTVITFAAIDRTTGTTNCTLMGSSTVTVNNSLSPISVSQGFKDCSSLDQISVTVKAPSGQETGKTFTIP